MSIKYFSNNSTRFLKRYGFLLVAVTFLSGCEFFKKDKAADVITKTADSGVVNVKTEGTGDTLLSIDGKSVLRESDFMSSMLQMLQANPYFRGASVDMLPAPIKRKFFDELIKQELIIAWASKNNVESEDDFIKAKADVLKLVNRSLLVQHFEKKVLDGIAISSIDVEAEFNKNKEKYVKVAGGVLVSGIKLDSEKADDFYEKANKIKDASEFEELAKEESEKDFEDFGRVRAGGERGLDRTPREIKTAVLRLKKFPVVEKVKAGKSTWVLFVSDKKEDVYFDLDEIKPQIEMMLKNAAFKEKLDVKIKNLRDDFKVDVNEKYFESLEADQAKQGKPVGDTKAKKKSSVAA